MGHVVHDVLVVRLVLRSVIVEGYRLRMQLPALWRQTISASGRRGGGTSNDQP